MGSIINITFQSRFLLLYVLSVAAWAVGKPTVAMPCGCRKIHLTLDNPKITKG